MTFLNRNKTIYIYIDKKIEPKNKKECDNSKIHISSNFMLSIILIMFDTLLLRPSLHCNTPLHFTTLHYTCRA